MFEYMTKNVLFTENDIRQYWVATKENDALMYVNDPSKVKVATACSMAKMIVCE